MGPQEDAGEVLGLSSREQQSAEQQISQKAEQHGGIRTDQVKGRPLKSALIKRKGHVTDRPIQKHLLRVVCLS